MAATETSVENTLSGGASGSSGSSLEYAANGVRELMTVQARTESKIQRLKLLAAVYRRELESTDPHYVRHALDEEELLTAYDLWLTEEKIISLAATGETAIAERKARMESGMGRLIKAQRFVVVRALQPEIYPIINFYSARTHDEAHGKIRFADFDPKSGGKLRFGGRWNGLWKTFDAAPLVHPETYESLFDIKLVPVK